MALDWLRYLMGGLQTAAGVGSEFFAPGNPAGTALIGGGLGQFGPMRGLSPTDLSSALSDPSFKGIDPRTSLSPSMVTGASPIVPGAPPQIGGNGNFLQALGLNPVDLLGGLASAAGGMKLQPAEYMPAPSARPVSGFGPSNAFPSMPAPTPAPPQTPSGAPPIPPQIAPFFSRALPFLRMLGIQL